MESVHNMESADARSILNTAFLSREDTWTGFCLEPYCIYVRQRNEQFAFALDGERHGSWYERPTPRYCPLEFCDLHKWMHNCFIGWILEKEIRGILTMAEILMYEEELEEEEEDVDFYQNRLQLCEFYCNKLRREGSIIPWYLRISPCKRARLA